MTLRHAARCSGQTLASARRHHIAELQFAPSFRVALAGAASVAQRATTTVAWAWVATCSETLPWRARDRAPRPRDPTMTMS